MNHTVTEPPKLIKRSRSCAHLRRLIFSLAACVATVGCASPRAAWHTRPLSDEPAVRVWDVDSDDRPDYRQQLDDTGRIRRLEFDADEDGNFEAAVDWPNQEDGALSVLIILDSVPHTLARAAWDAGQFRLFGPPAPLLAPFPVLTDVSLNVLFGELPALAIEAEYCDERRERGGLDAYLSGKVAHWQRHVDYFLPAIAHGDAYLAPVAILRRELRGIDSSLRRPAKPQGPFSWIGYMVSTSALGAQMGADGHRLALHEVDAFCEQLVYERRGKVRITLMSDHGHYLEGSQRTSLISELRAAGFKVGKRRAPGVLVVPEFAPSSCAAIYTDEPDRVARAVVTFDSVDLAMFQRNGVVHVLSARGEARVRNDTGTTQLENLRDDPLQTTSNETAYPAGPERAWQAFQNRFQYPPDVMVSLKDGWFVGSSLFTSWIQLRGVHGNLRAASSVGMLFSTHEPQDEPVHMHDLNRMWFSAPNSADEELRLGHAAVGKGADSGIARLRR